METHSLAQLLDALMERQRHLTFVLPWAQRQVLLILDKNKAANLSQLADMRQVRKSSMSVMLSQLIEQQLVVKGFSKSDRRQRLYLLSRHGKETLDKDMSLYQDWLDETLAALSADHKQSLFDALKQITSRTHV